MTLVLHAAAVTDRGLAREINEDALHVGPSLVAIADGIGGLPAGEVASGIVVTALAELEAGDLDGSPVEALRQTVERANLLIRSGVEANPAADGMGTTLTAMLVSANQIVLAHVGDSRAYLLRDGTLTQLTKDDTYVQMLVDEGAISAEQAGSHPHRSVVTRALQGQDVTPVITVLKPRDRDRFLLCSDGLSDVVADEAIAATLRDYQDREECTQRLLELALAGGGPDNITVAVADAATDEPTADERLSTVETVPDPAQPITLDLPAVADHSHRWLPWSR